MDIAFVSGDSWPTKFVNWEATVSCEDDKVKCLVKVVQTLGNWWDSWRWGQGRLSAVLKFLVSSKLIMMHVGKLLVATCCTHSEAGVTVQGWISGIIRRKRSKARALKNLTLNLHIFTFGLRQGSNSLDSCEELSKTDTATMLNKQVLQPCLIILLQLQSKYIDEMGWAPTRL